jgi:hypothetical protein
MAKKQDAEETTFVPETQAGTGEGEFTPGVGDMVGIDSDFNVEAEWKPIPLVPNGTYHGAVTDVKFNPELQSIQWQVTLNENGGLCNDGETPVDGTQHTYNNFLPKPGDENTPDRSGRGSKRQAKINMLKQFADNLKVNMNTKELIAKAIVNKEWIGIAVDAKIKIEEFKDAVTKIGTGRFKNEIERLVQRTS